MRYFNVFGRRQDPNGAYAAVIPKFISQLMKGESPVINGDGNYSRDFTYIDNVIQANFIDLSATNEKAINTVYNVAYGERNTLNDLIIYLKKYLSDFDSKIKNIQVVYGPNRSGDIPHSHASINKAKKNLNYNPHFSLQQGLKVALLWYWENLKNEKDKIAIIGLGYVGLPLARLFATKYSVVGFDIDSKNIRTKIRHRFNAGRLIMKLYKVYWLIKILNETDCFVQINCMKLRIVIII